MIKECPGGKLENVLENRTRRQRKPEGENLTKRAYIDVPIDARVCQYGLELRAEDKAVPGGRVEQRSNPDSIARKKQSPFLRVPDRESPLPIHTLDAIRTVFLVKPQDNFGVGPGGKPVPFLYKFLTQFDEVEDFPVESYPERAVITLHGLMTARNIDDAEPVVGQTNGPVCVRARAVGAAVVEHAD